jgi:uncharacterized protein YbjQ (UPF0145 family)
MDADRFEVLFLIIALAFVPLSFLFWWLIDRHVEGRHLRWLAEREAALDSAVLCTSVKTPVGNAPAPTPALIAVEVAIGSGTFKTKVFALRNIFGGESKSFTCLYGRAHRTALVRLREKALERGYDAVCNIRYGAADIGGNTSGGKTTQPMAICAISGTAYKRAR